MSIFSTIIEKLIAEASPKIIMAVIGGLVLVGGGTGVALSTSLHRSRAPKLKSTEAGVDFDKMTKDDLRLTKDTLFVTLPAPEILQVDMDSNGQDVFLQKGTWSIEQVQELYGPAKDKLIQDALDGGVLTKAFANAKEHIQDFFRPFGYTCVISQRP